MNPAILKPLLQSIGQAAMTAGAAWLTRDKKEPERSARDEAEEFIQERRQRREATLSGSDNENRDKALRQRLSDMVFAQTSKVDPIDNRDTSVQPQSGEQPSRRQIEEENEGVEQTRKFSDRLKEGAASVAGFLGPIGKAGAAIVGFVKGLELMNTGVLALNRDLAQFSGGLAAAYAQYDVDEMQRSVYRSEELSGPLSELAAAQSELRDGTNRVGTQITGIVAGVLTKVTETVNWLNKLTGLTDGVSSTLKDIREWLFGKSPEPEAGPWQTFFADVQDGKFDGKRPVFVRGSKNLHSDQDMRDIFG
jgi:hypothetical protein